MKNALARLKIRDILTLGIGVIPYALILIIPPAPSYTQLLYRFSLTSLVLLFAFIVLLMSRKGRFWEAVQASIVFDLFAIGLIYKWQFATSNGSQLGGLLPKQDAYAYYMEISRLILGFPFSSWGGNRPFFTSTLAGILYLTKYRVTLALIILTLVNAMATLIAARAVRLYYGPIGGAAYLLFGYIFYSRFAGLILSEQLGLILAHTALLFLLIGAKSGSFKRAVGGIAILTFTLNTRAGAFFILPLLVLWLIYYFRHRMVWWRTAGLMAVVIPAVFACNVMLAQRVTGTKGTVFSNYPQTLYGLASGNKGWYQVVLDHPGVTVQEIPKLTADKIRQDPEMLVTGIGRAYADYFGTHRGEFCYIDLGYVPHSVLINRLLWLFVILGLVHCVINWSKASSGLTVASFLGVISSVSLLPPYDGDSMRIYAGTIPFTALWVLTGLSVVPQIVGNLIRSAGGLVRICLDSGRKIAAMQGTRKRLVISAIIISIMLSLLSTMTFLNRKGVLVPYRESERLIAIDSVSQDHLNGRPEYSSKPRILGLLPPERPSPMAILENGKPLSPNLTIIGMTEIRFVASDQSDPRSNGRVYEVSYPFKLGNSFADSLYLITILTFGLTLLMILYTTRIFSNRPDVRWQKAQGEAEGVAPLQPLAVAFIVAAIACILLTASLRKSPPAREIPRDLTGVLAQSGVCPEGTEQVHGHAMDQLRLVLIGDDVARESYMPYMRLSDFRRTLSPIQDADYFDLEAGTELATGLNIRNGNVEELHLISDYTVGKSEFLFCGRLTKSEPMRYYGLYYSRSGKTVRPALTYSQRHEQLTDRVRQAYLLLLGIVLVLLIFSIANDLLADLRATG